MKTAVRDTSVEAYYRRIASPGVELSQIDRIVAYVLRHPCCTRRQIAAHFRAADPQDPLAQEARVSARVNAALKRRLLEESLSAVTDPATGEKAYPIYPTGYALQFDMFGRTRFVYEEARP